MKPGEFIHCQFLISQNECKVILQTEGDLVIEWANEPDVNDWLEFRQLHVPLRIMKKFGHANFRNDK
jgi:hypothetical protein